MAALHLRRKAGPRVPSRVRGINWASPLAQGLVWCYAPVTGSRWTFDTPKARRQLLSVPGGFAVGPDGVRGAVVDQSAAHYIEDPAGGAILSLTDIAAGGGPLSFHVRAYASSTNSSHSGFWRTNSGSNGTSFAILESNTRAWGRWAGGDVLRDQSGPTYFTAGSQLSVSYVFQSGGSRIVYDGVEQDSDTTTLSTLVSSQANIFRFGRRDASNAINGFYQQLLFFDQGLGVERARALDTHPWDIYDAGTRTISIPVATAATPDVPVSLLQSREPRNAPGLVGHFLADPARQNGLYSRDRTGRTTLRGS